MPEALNSASASPVDPYGAASAAGSTASAASAASVARTGESASPGVTLLGEGKAPASTASAPKQDSLANPQLPPPAGGGSSSMGMAELVACVAALQLETNELQMKVSEENINIEQQRLEEKHEKIATDIQERMDKLEKSAGFGLAAKILGWIGAGIALLATFASAFVTGGGSIAMFALACAGVGVMVAQECDVASLCKTEMGEKITNLCLGLAGIAFSAISISNVGKIGATAVKVGREVTEEVVRVASQVMTGVVQVGNAGSMVGTSVFDAQATDIQADLQKDNAALANIESVLREEMERMAELLKLIQSSLADASQMITSMNSSSSHITANVSM